MGPIFFFSEDLIGAEKEPSFSHARGQLD
jgi:hypothetical protein